MEQARFMREHKGEIPRITGHASLSQSTDVLSQTRKWDALQTCDVGVGPALDQHGNWTWDEVAVWVVADKKLDTSLPIPDYIPWQIHVWKREKISIVKC